jgi:hypothetical protein
MAEDLDDGEEADGARTLFNASLYFRKSKVRFLVAIQIQSEGNNATSFRYSLTNRKGKKRGFS